MVDFINEVQEELRKDDYNKWLRKYGPYVAGLVVAILIVASVLEWRKVSVDREARAMSIAYVEAGKLADGGDIDASVAAFGSLAERAPDGYAGLSYMRAGALEADRGNREAAVRFFDEAASRFTAPRHAQLAKLKAAYLLSAEGRPADADARLVGLTERGMPYEFLARELQAYNALSQGDSDRAEDGFAYLATIPGVPGTTSDRAKQTLSLLRAGKAAEIEAAPQDETGEMPEAGDMPDLDEVTPDE